MVAFGPRDSASEPRARRLGAGGQKRSQLREFEAIGAMTRLRPEP